MQGRTSSLDSSRISRSSSSRAAHLPPLNQQKHNIIIEAILSAKGSRAKPHEPNIELHTDIGKMLLMQPCEQQGFNRDKDCMSKLLRMVISKGKKVSQCVQIQKGKEDMQLVKHLLGSTSIKLALENIFERMTRRGQIDQNLKGVNRQILEQIEKVIFQSVQKQAKIFVMDREYNKTKSSLRSELDSYKKSIKSQLENLRMP